jgi:HJR/Mrr/RecB family endonuclease
LKEAVYNNPVISISREPMDFGTNLIQEETKDKSNIFRQVLRGAKLAQTEYIAIAEDDTLYPPEHFKLRPK